MRRRARIGPSCLVVAAVLLAGLAAAGARAPAEQAPRLVLTSGGLLQLSDSLGGGAVLDVEDIRPGDSASGTVVVSNGGSAGGVFSLAQANLADSPGPLGGALSTHLLLAVEELLAGGSIAQSVYSGPLAGFAARPLGLLGPGQTRAYRFTVSFPEGGVPAAPGLGDDRFQGASIAADYVWTVVADGPGGGAGGGPVDGGGGGGTTGPGGGVVGGGGLAGGTPGQGSLTLRLAGRRKQRPLRGRRLVLTATCNTSCRLSPALRVPKTPGLKKVRSRPVAAAAGKRTRLVFKLSGRKAKALRRALRKRRRVIATAVVTARTDSVKVTAKRRILLKR